MNYPATKKFHPPYKKIPPKKALSFYLFLCKGPALSTFSLLISCLIFHGVFEKKKRLLRKMGVVEDCQNDCGSLPPQRKVDQLLLARAYTV